MRPKREGGHGVKCGAYKRAESFYTGSLLGRGGIAVRKKKHSNWYSVGTIQTLAVCGNCVVCSSYAPFTYRAYTILQYINIASIFFRDDVVEFFMPMGTWEVILAVINPVET